MPPSRECYIAIMMFLSWMRSLASPFPSVSVLDSSLQAHLAFPMKDLLLSEGVMAQEGSVWRNGGKSLLFPGKVESNTM